jgi:hypothetical protein
MDARRDDDQAVNLRASVLTRWKFAGRSRDGGAFELANDEQVHRNGQRSAAEVGQPLNSRLYCGYPPHGVVINQGRRG